MATCILCYREFPITYSAPDVLQICPTCLKDLRDSLGQDEKPPEKKHPRPKTFWDKLKQNLD